MSTIYLINYNSGDESGRSRCLSSLAAPHEVLLRAAKTPAIVWSRIRPLPDSVSRAPPDRARASLAHEPARRHAVVRRVERHRAGRSFGIPRSRSASAFPSGPPRQGASTHGSGRATPGAPAETDDGRVSPAVAALSRPAAKPGENPRGARRREVSLGRHVTRIRLLAVSHHHRDFSTQMLFVELEGLLAVPAVVQICVKLHESFPLQYPLNTRCPRSCASIASRWARTARRRHDCLLEPVGGSSRQYACDPPYR
jgi:hypothetical protein